MDCKGNIENTCICISFYYINKIDIMVQYFIKNNIYFKECQDS